MSNLPEFSAMLPVGLIREAFRLTVTSDAHEKTLNPGEEVFLAETESGKRFRGSPTIEVKVLELPANGSYPANTSTLGRFAAVESHGQPVVRNLATGENADYPLTVSSVHVAEGTLIDKGDPVCELRDSAGQQIRMRSPEPGRILSLEFSKNDTILRRSEFFSLQTDRLEVPGKVAVGLFSWNTAPQFTTKQKDAEPSNQASAGKETRVQNKHAESSKPERTPFIIGLWRFLFYGTMALVIVGLLFGERLSSGIKLVSRTYERIVNETGDSEVSGNESVSDSNTITSPLSDSKQESSSDSLLKLVEEKRRNDVLDIARREIEALGADADPTDGPVVEATKPVRDRLYGNWEKTNGDEKIYFSRYPSGSITPKGGDEIPTQVLGPYWSKQKKMWIIVVSNETHDIWRICELAELMDTMMVLRPEDEKNYLFYTRIKN